MHLSRNLHILLILATCLLIICEMAVGTPPAQPGTPPAPASNIKPPAAFIGLLITFFCIGVVVAVNLIPSNRKDVK